MENEVKFWMGVLICPLSFLTMLKVIHFSHKNGLMCQSVDLLIILGVVFLTGFTSTYFNAYTKNTNRDGDSYTYVSNFYAWTYLLSSTATYLFAFKYFDSVLSIVKTKETHPILKFIRYFLWIMVPIINLALTITYIIKLS